MAVVVGTQSFSASFTQTVTSGLTVTQTPRGAVTQSLSYTNGTAANMVDFLYAKRLTLAVSTPQTIDLQALADIAGNTVNMLRVREFIVQVVDTTLSHTVLVEAGASNGWAILPAGGIIAAPGGTGIVHLSDPVSVGGGVGYVTGSGSKTVKFDPGAIQIIIDVLIAGCSAVS